MTIARTGTDRSAVTPGKTRVCPHCKSIILDSASICPACRHHLRFGQQAETRAAKTYSAFHVEGTVQHGERTAAEYSVVVTIRNGQGVEIKRHVIDVGAMKLDERRSFDLSVEVSTPR